MDRQFATCILASTRNGTLYIGMTSNLVARIWQHREHVVDGFTQHYGVTRLVCYEMHGAIEAAITREKRIENWKRAWKLRLIEERNPYWNDLWPQLLR